MAYTIQEIGARARAKKPEAFTKFTDEQIGQRLVDRDPRLKSMVATSTPAQQVAPVAPVAPKEPGLIDKIKTGTVKRVENIADIGTKVYQGKLDPISGGFATAGQLGRAIFDPIGETIGAGFSKITPEPVKEEFKKFADVKLPGVGGPASINENMQSLAEGAAMLAPYWETFKKKHPTAASNIEATGNIALTGLDATILKDTKSLLSSIEANTKKKIAEIKLPKLKLPPATPAQEKFVEGTKQIVSDIGERIPTAGKRIGETVTNAAEKSAKIKNAEPAVANAYKANLDERLIDTLEQADDTTRKSYKAVVDIANETPKGVQLKRKPSIVSGDLAAKQVDLIVAEKKKVGQALGDQIKSLSKTEKVDITDGFKEIDDVLSGQGIKITQGERGVELDFSGSKFTPAERKKIQELFDLTSEGGYNLTPAQIHAKDQLFSKLQREAAMEGVGNIMVETAEGKTKSLFGVFRDVFSKKLDTVSPEIKSLNAQYRNLYNIVDDIENSILKTPNFNATKAVDQAEFAKVNLRRILGDAQSSPAYEAVADQMDALARQLGYKEASPKDIAEFAEYLRKLYPESVPKAGFQGGIKTGVNEIFQSVYKLGTPNAKDQQKALNDLLDFYISGKKPSTNLIDKNKLFPPKKKTNILSELKNNQQGFAKIPRILDEEGRDALIYNLDNITASDLISIGDEYKQVDIDMFGRIETLKKIFEKGKDTPADIREAQEILARLGKLENPLDNVKLPKGNGATTLKTALGGLEQEATKYKTAEEFVKAQESDILKNKQWDYQDALKEYNIKNDAIKKEIGTFVTSEKKSSGNYGVKFTSLKDGNSYANEFPTRKMALDAVERFKDTLGKKVKDIEFLDTKSLDEFNLTSKKDSLIKKLNEPAPKPEDYGFYTKSQLTDIWNKANKLPPKK